MDKSSYGRKDRLVKEREHDVYRSRTKLPDPIVCPDCGAVYMKGRWVWRSAPIGASPFVCPACRRTAENFPVGFIELKGEFFAGHHDEIINMVRNVEAKEKASHPMERIMGVEEHAGSAQVTTTGIHVARGIGSALSNAYKGELSMQYLDAEHCIRVRWIR